MSGDMSEVLTRQVKFKNSKAALINYKSLIWVLILGIAIWWILPRIVGVKEAVLLISQASIGWIILAIVVQFISFLGVATMIQALVGSLKYKIPFFELFKIGIISAFAINVLPVGGLGGIALTYYLLRRKGIKASDNVLIFILRSVLTYFFFGILFLISMVYIPTLPNLSLIQRIVVIVINIIAWATFGYLIYLYRNEKRFRKKSHIWQKIVNFFSGLFVRRKILNQEKTQAIITDLYRGTDLFLKQRNKIFWGSFGSVIYWLGSMACLGLVFIAFDYGINLGVLVFGYSVATILSIISFIPGGLGVMEGSLALLFISMQVPSDIALMSILVFRLISFWLPMIFGFFAFVSFRRDLLRVRDLNANS